MSNTILQERYSHPRDKEIKFYSRGHKYEILCDKTSKYTSVTTWNHKHFPKFDADAIIAKMFKSTKYYFCNKSMAETKPVKRKAYDESNRELLDLMDAFVLSVYTIPPKHGFAQFCTLYTKDEGDARLKKMFKNRHYRIVREHAK